MVSNWLARFLLCKIYKPIYSQPKLPILQKDWTCSGGKSSRLEGGRALIFLDRASPDKLLERNSFWIGERHFPPQLCLLISYVKTLSCSNHWPEYFMKWLIYLLYSSRSKFLCIFITSLAFCVLSLPVKLFSIRFISWLLSKEPSSFSWYVY